ncbi:hypothetical protein EDB85DRAFT_542895 [Lactarius pseudohatsudake]|nr:hypothetical protein EDB85DRAFT_542895 [Lactarius pseudohatsudake]
MLNPPGPSETENSGISTQIIESRGSPGPPHLRVEITVLRAHNVPNIKNRFGKKSQYFVTVASQTTKRTTSSVPAEGTKVEWNENVDAFYVQSSSRLVLCLYAARFAGRDILIGTHGMMPLESQSDVPFALTNSGRPTGQTMQPVTLYLTVTVSMNMTSHPGSTVAAGIETLSYPKDRPSEITASVPPAADGSAGISPAKNALRNADEAMTTIKLSNTWEGALERIKWVMDTVSSVADSELHPYAKMAYGLLFAIPKTLLEQFQRDDNIRTLLVAMHDAFDFTSQDHTFKAIGRESKQAHILTLMLQHVCNCCDFIRSYAKDSQLWKRMLKNTGGQVNTRIGDFRTVLLELRKEFLDHATIAAEITAFQILDDVGIVSTRVDWISTQLQWVSDQVSDADRCKNQRNSISDRLKLRT